MNGFVLLCGALCLTSGPASGRPEAVVLGTGGTILPIPVGVPVGVQAD